MFKVPILILTLGSFSFTKASLPTSEEILTQQRPESWPEWVDVEMDASILSDEVLFGEDGIYPKEVDPKKLGMGLLKYSLFQSDEAEEFENL